MVPESPGITALVNQLRDSRLGTGLSPAPEVKSPLGARNAQPTALLGQQIKSNTTAQLLHSSKKLVSALPSSHAGLARIPESGVKQQTPIEEAPAAASVPAAVCPTSGTPTTCDRPVRGRLVFECTEERTLESISVAHLTTLRKKKQPAKRRLEDSFGGGGDAGGDKRKSSGHRQPTKRAYRRPSSAPMFAKRNLKAPNTVQPQRPATAVDPSPMLHKNNNGRMSWSHGKAPPPPAIVNTNTAQPIPEQQQHQQEAELEFMPSTSGVFHKAINRSGALAVQQLHHLPFADAADELMAAALVEDAQLDSGFSPLQSNRSILPVVDHPDCGCPCITPQTLKCLLESGGNSGLSDFVIIDCRFNYEYSGGHISGAHNLATPGELETFLESAEYDWNNTAVIFYCEFSSERAPRAFRHTRQEDRKRSFERYDLVSLQYPHMFVLEGGYSQFVDAAPQNCSPCGCYVSMHDPEYEFELQACTKMVREAWAAIDPCAKNNPNARRKNSRKSYRVSDPSRMQL